MGQEAAQDPTFKLNVLYNLGNEALQLGDFNAAVRYLEEAAQLSQEALDPEKLATAYWELSLAASAQNDNRRAKQYAIRSLVEYEDASARRLTARVYSRLGRAQAQSGNADEALAHLDTAYTMAEQRRDQQALAEAKRGDCVSQQERRQEGRKRREGSSRHLAGPRRLAAF
jgi:tetratricopeptide (TPR) repeat protein